MEHITARKRLFAETYRRRPFTGAPRPRLLGGQALAKAQRLAQPALRPSVLSLALFALELLAVIVIGRLVFALTVPLELGEVKISGILWLTAFLMVVTARLLGGYRFRRMRALPASLAIGILALALAIGITRSLLAYAGIEAGGVDRWLGAWALGAVAAVLILRGGMRLRIGALVRRRRLEHRIVVVGGGPALSAIIHEIDKERGKGRRMCGFFDERSDQRSPNVIAGYHKMGDLDDLVEFARLARIDTVIIAIPQASHLRIQQLLGRLFVLPVDIRVLDGAEIPEFSRKRRSAIGRFKLIEIYKRPFTGARAVQKRIFDVIFATLALFILAPVMLVVAALIRLESRGPVLFVQRRHGFNNAPITVLKFRSMYHEACDPTAVKAVRRHDARVTRVGRIIRRASLDELPQFLNVLRGDLSLVGPRPHALAARTGDILYDRVTEAYSARHRVKPGITGWAQINGWRGEMNSSEKIRARIEHDLYYIENWSLWLDLKIMLLTPYSLIKTKNAY
ncbi:undecaprenyl-phosphate glucose phosphotransferase [Pararhodobacter oceanensis]|uniref:undecaprenyl-phosphate glucose phosphotransferase n=1 Tax=Pararhodobacter oceanensis TaxID=2172121 RepID=UPI003A92E33F